MAAKVIFALDPLEPELVPDPSSIRWLRHWMDERSASLEAVYIASWPSEAAEFEKTQNEFEIYVRQLGLGDSVRATVLISKSTSRRKAVQTLVDLLQRSNADFVVVSSHGRAGVGRWMMGSFAERLLGESPIPVLFLSDRHEGLPQLKKILFPTDFSESSKCALELLLNEFQGFGGEIILFHADSPPGVVADTGILGIPVYYPEDVWVERKYQIQHEATRIANEVTARGFGIRTVLQEGVLDVVSAIEHVAEAEKVDLIAMTSTDRGIDLMIAGGVARQVFRMRRWPVWVCGPEAVESARRLSLSENPRYAG